MDKATVTMWHKSDKKRENPTEIVASQVSNMIVRGWTITIKEKGTEENG